MILDGFISSFFATILGGLLLAVIFFWSREKLFSIPDITGKWYFKIKTENTEYKPYEGMELTYIAILWREGSKVEGTVEKIHENSSTGERDFIGKNRTRGHVSGYIEKNYFSGDRVYLHVVENGHGRESTNYYDLLVLPNSELNGEFSSMVAGQDGSTTWKREKL